MLEKHIRIFKGFTILEFQVVILIIGILAVLATPPMHQYLERARVAEALILLEPLKQQVVKFHDRFGYLPVDNQEAGLAPAAHYAGNYVEQIVVDRGVIIATLKGMGESLNGKKLHLQPAFLKQSEVSNVFWRCEWAPLPDGIELAVVVNASAMNIDAQYLPTSCRGVKTNCASNKPCRRNVQ